MTSGPLDEDLEKLAELASLYTQVKALIIYSEDIDRSSRSNIQVIKELRDAFDHVMRVISARMSGETPQDVEASEYCRNNLQKAVGHVYRAAFDALDGTVVSLRASIAEIVNAYPLPVLKEVVPEYWDMRSDLNRLCENISDHRARKDVGRQIGVTFDRYVEDVECIKRFHDKLLHYGPALDECLKRTNSERRANSIKDTLRLIGVAVAGGLLTLLVTYALSGAK